MALLTVCAAHDRGLSEAERRTALYLRESAKAKWHLPSRPETATPRRDRGVAVDPRVARYEPTAQARVIVWTT
ncbi:hypothetical protein, partial [Nonomuraea angiospora]